MQSRAKTSFFLIRCALICLRGSRLTRKVPCYVKNADFDVQLKEGRNMTVKFFRFSQLLIEFLKLVILNMDFISGHRLFFNFFS